MKYWFTSDTHFGHANIIKYCSRPFSNAEDFGNDGKWVSYDTKHKRTHLMDETLIANWNEVVGDDDIVYHNGDFAYGSTAFVLKILRALKGKIYFIWGNHDDNLKQVARIIDFYPDLKNRIKFVGDYAQISVNGQDIILMHYAMRVWNHSHRGSWHLYGHSHGTLDDDKNSLSFDIGCDCHNYFPISYERLQEIMAQKIWKPIDHHGERHLEGGIGLSKLEYGKAERRRQYEMLKAEFEEEPAK